MKMKETCFNYCYDQDNNDGRAWFSSDERKFINRIHALKEKYPDKIEILKEPEDNDGCIYACLPQTWLRVQPNVTRELTAEELDTLRERLEAIRHPAG